MSGNSKQPAAGGQQQMRYSQSYQSMPQPRETFQLPAQNYVPQNNQAGNQGAGLRGIPQTGPPNQAPTPPNQDLKVAQQPPMNLYQPQQNQVRQPQYYRQPGPQQTNQTPRMPNNQHRVAGQQQMYQPNPQYVQMPTGMYPLVLYAGHQRQNYVQQPPVLLPSHSYPYTFQQQALTQTQPTVAYQYIPQMAPRQGPPPPPASTMSNPNQQPLPTMSMTQTMTQQQTLKKKKRPNAIAIIDPTTGANKLDELYHEENSRPPSGESSARQTPQPAPHNPNKEVQAAFAKQVAQTLIQDDSLAHQHQQPVVVVQQQQQQYAIEQQHHQLEDHRMRNQSGVVAGGAGTPDMVTPIPYHHAPQQQQQQQQQQMLQGHVIGGAAKFDHIIQTSNLKVQAPEFVLQVKEPTAMTTPAQPAVKEPPVVSAITDAEEVTLFPSSKQHHQQQHHHHHQKGRESPVKGRKKDVASASTTNQQQQQHQQPSLSSSSSSSSYQQQQQHNNKVVVPEAVATSACDNKESIDAVYEELANSPDLYHVPQHNKDQQQQQTKTTNYVEVTPKEMKKAIFKAVTTARNNGERGITDDAEEANNAKTKNSSQRKDAQKAGVQQKTGAGPNIVPPPQPAKSNSKTSKKIDLNTKGANKEGTDMDVFQSSDALNANNNLPPQINNNQQQQQQKHLQQQQTTTTTTTVVAERDDDLLNANATDAAPAPNDNASAQTGAVNNRVVQPAPSATAPIVANSTNDNDTTATTAVNKTQAAPAPAETQQLQNKSKKVDVTNVFGGKTVQPATPHLVAQTTDNRDETDRASTISNERLIQAKNEMNTVKSAAQAQDDKKVELSYKQGQWSPSCPEGNKIYELDFLLALKNAPCSLIKPSNLPDVLLNSSDNRQRQPDTRYRTDYGMFPGFGKNSSMKGSQSITKHNSLSGKVNNKSGKSTNGANKISISLKEDIKLHETENAWKPGRLAKVDTRTEDEKKSEDLYKKVRSVLNKLTPQKFDTLLKQIKDLKIETVEHLQGVINLIFEKAIDEPNFSVAYAKMCKELSKINVNTGQEKQAVFKPILINRCQEEFEKQSKDEHRTNEKMTEIEKCEDPEKKKELDFELEEIIRRLRMRSVGNIRFIGELFKIQMLTPNIMLSCLNKLLSNKDEDSLECLCKLLSTIGKALEDGKDGKDLTKFFNIMQDIVDKKQPGCKVSSRIRFMLQDVIDLRRCKWVPRRQDMNPKTIDQIAKEAENEQINQSLNNSAMNTPRKDDASMSKGGVAGGNKSRMPNEDGWTMSRTTPRNAPFVVQKEKLKMKSFGDDEPFGGSHMFQTWGKGAQYKGGPSTNTTGLTNTTNKYALLDSTQYDGDKKSGGYNKHNMGGYSSKGSSLERSNYGSKQGGYDSRSGSQHRTINNDQQQYQQQQQSSLMQNNNQSMTSSSSSSMQRAQAPASTTPTLQRGGAAQSQQHMPPQQQQQQQQQQGNVVAPSMTEEQMERFLKNILEEYINDNCTFEECDEDIAAKIPVNYMARMVSYGFLSILEKFEKARLKTGLLFAKLIKSGTLPLNAYCAGLEEIFIQIEDLIIDIPMIWKYLAQIIAPAICEESLPLDRLRETSDILIKNQTADKLIAPTFRLIVSEKGPNFLRDLWRGSRVQFEDFVAPQNVDAFVAENKLEFLNGAEPTQGDSDFNNEQIEAKLLEFFESGASFDDVNNWITANVGEKTKEVQFVRTLATAIYKYSISNGKLQKEKLTENYKLFQRYVDAHQPYELQCLYALQSLVDKMEHPQGLLVSIFNQLSEDVVIPQESFIAWEVSSDPAEQGGKGVALKQLTSFFTQLKENDDEEEEEDISSGGDN